MKKRDILNTFVVCALLLLFTVIIPNVRGAVSVGDKPTLKFTASGGAKVDLAALKGKIVVVDFWATWCGPCMAEANHMVSLNKDYAPKGMQFIGISLDQNESEMKSVAKEKGFEWPQYFDGKVWQNTLAKQWGVDSIPRTFLIGPDGDVLWTGHPAQIDAVLKDAFEKHPPKLVDDAVLASANALLDRADASLKDKKYPAALAALSKVPADARKDQTFAARSDELNKQVDQASKELLSAVDEQIKQKQYVDAVSALKSVIAALPGTAAAKDAQQKLGDLMKNPEASAQIEAAQKSQKADELLAAAQQLQTNKKDAQAYAAFKQIASGFAETTAGKTAAAEVSKYEADPNFVKKAAEENAGGKAKGMLSLARNYKSLGKVELAKKKFQEIVDQYPNTSYADTAKKEISDLK